jgi:hypothetical protein
MRSIIIIIYKHASIPNLSGYIETPAWGGGNEQDEATSNKREASEETNTSKHR